MKQEEGEKNGKGPPIDNVTNSKASKATFNKKKTNKQNDNTADLSRYFYKNKWGWSNYLTKSYFVILSELIIADDLIWWLLKRWIETSQAYQ